MLTPHGQQLLGDYLRLLPQLQELKEIVHSMLVKKPLLLLWSQMIREHGNVTVQRVIGKFRLILRVLNEIGGLEPLPTAVVRIGRGEILPIRHQFFRAEEIDDCT